MLLPSQTVLKAAYAVEKALGEPAAFELIYVGKHLQTQQQVFIREYFPQRLVRRSEGGAAVEVIGPEEQALFRFGQKQYVREAALLAKIAHPHVEPLQDCFEENGTAYRVSLRQPGVSLAAYLEQQQEPLSERAVLALMGPILEALDAAHQQRLLHGGVSPELLFMTQEAQLVLCDFQMAHLLLAQRRKRYAEVVRPGYTPPELYGPQGSVGPWTDLYGWAATFYRLLSGRGLPAVPERLKEDTVPALLEQESGLSLQVRQALACVLSLDVAQRPESVGAFQHMLARPVAPKREVPMPKPAPSILPEAPPAEKAPVAPVSTARKEETPAAREEEATSADEAAPARSPVDAAMPPESKAEPKAAPEPSPTPASATPSSASLPAQEKPVPERLEKEVRAARKPEPSKPEPAKPAPPPMPAADRKPVHPEEAGAAPLPARAGKAPRGAQVEDRDAAPSSHIEAPRVQERLPADNEPAARPLRPAPEVETQMKPKRVALYGLGLLLLALLAGGGTLVMLTYQPGSATAMNTPEARYEHFRSWGDSLFALANYAAARDLYARALTARPKDVHATARMEEAEHMRMLTQDEAYARLRIRGDSLFARRSYMKALEAYRDALGKRPGDPVMLEKVQKAIERLLAASMRVPPAQPDAARSAPQPDVEPEPMALLPLQAPSAPLSEEQAELYRLARKQGDSLFILGNYSGARERFEDALRYQPADAYTAALVEEIDRIADEKVRDEQYRSSLEEGDALFDQKRLVEAQEAYERALELKPRDAAAASRLAEINNLLAQTQRKEDLYKYFRKQADGHLETGNYEVAISRYKKAMEYRPDDEYALRKIEEAEQALAAKRAQY